MWNSFLENDLGIDIRLPYKSVCAVDLDLTSFHKFQIQNPVQILRVIASDYHLSAFCDYLGDYKMRLSDVLFRRNLMPNGHIFRGKDRLVKKVETKHLRWIKNSFEIEEQNMFYLRFPYLTEAESSGHAKELGKADIRKKAFEEHSRRCFKDDVTVYDRLQHLRVSESWD